MRISKRKIRRLAAPSVRPRRDKMAAQFSFPHDGLVLGKYIYMKIATIGTDGHLHMVFDGFPLLDDVELVGMARGQPDDRPERFRASPGVPENAPVFDDYRQMLDRTKPDLVTVATPYGLHAEPCIEAAQRGCHLIVEKPVATTLEDLYRIRQAVRAHKVRLTTLFAFRFFPVVAAMRKAIQGGMIGEPVLAFGQKSYRWGTSRPEFYKRRETYGGSIPWVAIHAIDYIRYVTGQEYASVAALHATKVHRDYPECEDCGGLLFKLANGGQAVITIDFLRPEKASTHADDRLRVAGSKGVIEMLDANQRVELITHEKPPHDLPLEKTPQFLVDFVRELRTGEPHLINAEDPFKVTEIALHAREAADKGMIVNL